MERIYTFAYVFRDGTERRLSDGTHRRYALTDRTPAVRGSMQCPPIATIVSSGRYAVLTVTQKRLHEIFKPRISLDLFYLKIVLERE
jgi:hypothetical protein